MSRFAISAPRGSVKLSVMPRLLWLTQLKFGARSHGASTSPAVAPRQPSIRYLNDVCARVPRDLCSQRAGEEHRQFDDSEPLERGRHWFTGCSYRGQRCIGGSFVQLAEDLVGVLPE